MRVLLVQSWLGGSERPVYPLGLACLVPYLKQAGHEVRAYDPNLSADPYGGLERELSDFNPDVVGISLRNIDSTNKRKVVFYYPELARAAEAVKRRLPSCKVVVGGSGFSMFASEIMDEVKTLDFGVPLEGERTLAALLGSLDRPESVPGVYYRAGDGVRFTGHAGLTQMEPSDSLAPDRQTLPVSLYSNIPEAVGIETKRGCALGCIYCIYGFLNGKRIRLKSASKVADEIEALVSVHGLTNFTFIDSVFNIPKSHAEDICNEIIRRGIKARWSAWYSEKHLDREFVELAERAGCMNFILSPDGFTDETLRKLGKNITNEEIVAAMLTLASHSRAEVSYNFFKNPPGQTLGGFLAMARFCVRARKLMGRRAHFEFNSMRIEPHTGLYALALKEGIISEGMSLLRPAYYTNRSTRYIEKLLNAVLILKGK